MTRDFQEGWGYAFISVITRLPGRERISVIEDVVNEAILMFVNNEKN